MRTRDLKGSGTGLSEFTPTQRRMLRVLADGLPHSRAELHACLWDERGPLSNIKTHLFKIRKVLSLRGEDIVCVLHRRTVHYRHVRLLA